MSSDYDWDEDSGVVIDNGTRTLKAGYSGDDMPRLVWSNLLATPRSEVQMISMGLKDQYIGEEAQEQRGRLALRYPMRQGVVQDWDAMEQVWQAVFQELDFDPTANSVLISDRPLNPRPHKERTAETMFETFEVPRLYIMSQGVLSMYESGRGYAVVMDCGEGATTIMPIEESYIRPHAILRGPVSGSDLTSHLQTVMAQRGFDVMHPEGLESLREAKEELCYVAQDYKKEIKEAQESSSLNKRYELPDGQLITLGEERILVPEALFRPYLIGKEGLGIHKLVYKSIMSCDIDARIHFYVNIISRGGCTLFPGFNERLQKEIKALVPEKVRVRVVKMCGSVFHSAFIGGSIVSSLSSFQNSWITRKDYEEHGPFIVHKKCTG